MANKVHFSSSNDRLVVEAGGVVELNGGEIQGNRPPRLLPPPVGTTDGYVLTAKGTAPGGADWEAGGGGFNPTITSPQEGDVIARVGGMWVNKPGPLWTPADARSWGGGDGALPAGWLVGDAATLAWDNPSGYLRLSASAADVSVPLLRVPLPAQDTYAVAFRVWAPMAYSHQGNWWLGFSSDDTLGTLDGIGYDVYQRTWREYLGASVNGALGTFATGFVWQPIWFSLFDDGTNVHWAVSYDGVLWQEDDNEPHTAAPTSFVVGLATANHTPADLAISSVQFGATALAGIWT